MLQNIQRKCSLNHKYSVTQILKVFHIGCHGGGGVMSRQTTSSFQM